MFCFARKNLENVLVLIIMWQTSILFKNQLWGWWWSSLVTCLPCKSKAAIYSPGSCKKRQVWSHILFTLALARQIPWAFWKPGLPYLNELLASERLCVKKKVGLVRQLSKQRHLPCNPSDLSLIPESHVKKSDVVAHICDPGPSPPMRTSQENQAIIRRPRAEITKEILS